MNYTTNFNLNKPEGTDLYNHLTVDNPNMDTIDAAMQANKLASVGAATELVSGTIHAITRSDSNQNIFKFKATGDFKAGDTITVDGVSVNAYTTGGQALLDNAYKLSAEVLCILDNTSLWVLVNKTPDAYDVDYDNTSSGLSANNVNDAIDKLNNYREFKAGDEYIIYPYLLTHACRLGVNRTRLLFTVSLPKKITTPIDISDVILPSSITVYASDENRVCTAGVVQILFQSENVIGVMLSLSPNNAWSHTSDTCAVMEFSGTFKITF